MRLIIPLLLLGFIHLNLSAQKKPHALESIGQHYAELARLSGSPDSKLAKLDSISFPMQEYTSTSLTTEILRPIYLRPKDESKLPQILQVPANSSTQTQAELTYLLNLQQKRSAEDIAKSKYLASIGFSVFILNPSDSNYTKNLDKLFFIAKPLGAWMTYDNFPLIGKLLQNAMRDIRITEYRLKRVFLRPRPVHLEPKLQPLEKVGSPAFPSGHTLFSFTQAYLFSEIIPEKRDVFLAGAEAARRSREILGIHYPSDNEASRILGWHLLRLWMKNPAFQKDLRAAKAEWNREKSKYLEIK